MNILMQFNDEGNLKPICLEQVFLHMLQQCNPEELKKFGLNGLFSIFKEGNRHTAFWTSKDGKVLSVNVGKSKRECMKWLGI